MNEILFQITKDNLETGLRGYPVGYCTTSTVDPTQGLFYVGKPLSQMADWQPEEVIYLLFKGKEGSAEEVRSFKDDLAKNSCLSPELIAQIRLLPRLCHPMKLFATALLLMETFEGKGDYKEDCLQLIAKIPHLAATVINHHAGWGEGSLPAPKLGYIENFTQMLQVPNANRQELEEVFRLFNILHYDHGGGNLSAFVGKAIASGLEDMYGSIAGAMCALAGPRHGRANQESLAFVYRILNDLGAEATAEQLEAYLRKLLANNELIFGFGHAVLRVEDPRATLLYSVAQSRYPNHPLVKIALLLRSEGPKVLGENSKINDPYPNIDAISGTLLTAAGFSYPDYFTLLFGMARVVGISIQIVYERCLAREGKGTPIVRPKYFFKPLTS